MEAGDETTREFDGEAAEERRAQGSTVAALNAFSAGVASEVRADLGFVDPDEAIKTLAGAVDQDTLQVPRLLVLDSLVRFASRRGDEFRAREAEIDPLLEALVRKSQVPETEVGDAVDTVHRALESVAGLSGEELGERRRSPGGSPVGGFRPTGRRAPAAHPGRDRKAAVQRPRGRRQGPVQSHRGDGGVPYGRQSR